MSEHKNEKSKFWVFVAYPESLPAGWEEIISQTGIKWSHGPIHDKDVTATGEPKKPHFHCLLCWPGPTTFNNVRNLVVEKLGQPIPQVCHDPVGAYKYFWHLENPEKYQYDTNEKYLFNGFVWSDYQGNVTPSEQRRRSKECLKLIRELPCHEYKQLLDYLDLNNEDELFDFARSNTVMLKEYIKGQWRIDTGNENLPR